VQKPDFVFRRNGRVHLNRRGRQFSRLLAAELCASVVVMLDTCSEVVRRVLATHSIRQFPLHFPSRASPCAITFQPDSITGIRIRGTTVFPALKYNVGGDKFKNDGELETAVTRRLITQDMGSNLRALKRRALL